ncbi:MAG TPA: DEAD/DEAH box helicase, partial [Candidatus Aenigmarchaeota archaeon]|nr:DEAD/DEAH box helicase [Candidatus Aenigmarchaeota archaeon]
MLPVFDMWLREKPEPISILYITPLRSLNRDLLARIEWWSENLKFSVMVRHGDTPQAERAKQAKRPPDMLITTPETLQAVLTGKLMRDNLRNIRYILIDEVHELVSNKRGLQLSVCLERLKILLREKPQILCMSATVGSPERIVKFFSLDERMCRVINVANRRKNRIIVESPRPKEYDRIIAQKIMVSPEIAARIRRIRDLIMQRKSVLTFTNTREFSEILTSRLRALEKDIPIEAHHSSLSKDVRISAETGLKENRIKSLICTSSLELGIDIGSIDLVIQYMSPRQVSKILQRIGRSGHSIDRTSDGIIISSDPDDCFESAVIAELAMKNCVEPTCVYNGALDILANQILGLSLDEYRIPAARAFRIIKRAYPYRNLTFEEFMETALLLQKLRLLWVDSKFEKEPVLKRRKNTFLHYYTNLSPIPDTKNYTVFDVVSDKPVGTLDAEFVALHGQVGTAFIVKGQAWKILDVGRDKVMVEPLPGIHAAIPAWEGELIPVPFEVAQNVGR